MHTNLEAFISKGLIWGILRTHTHICENCLTKKIAYAQCSCHIYGVKVSVLYSGTGPWRPIFLHIFWTASLRSHTIRCCYCLVTESCPTIYNPMNCSTPRFPVFHYLPEFAQTHVHWVSDAIQPFTLLCPLLLLPSSFPRISVFSNESVFWIKWPKYLELQPQCQSFQWLFRVDFL